MRAVDGRVVADEGEADARVQRALPGAQDHRDRGRVEEGAALDVDQDRPRVVVQRRLGHGDALVPHRGIEVALDLDRVEAVVDRLPPMSPLAMQLPYPGTRGSDTATASAYHVRGRLRSRGR